MDRAENSSMDMAQRYSGLMTDCDKALDEAIVGAQTLIDHLRTQKNRNGISLLEVKNRDLMVYMAEMCQLMHNMLNGHTILDHPSIDQLVYLRTVIERIRPMEMKLRHHIDKLIKSSNVENSMSSILGGRFRARPEAMEFDDGDGEPAGSGEEEEMSDKKSKKYVPPKLLAVRYDEDDGESERRSMERARRRAHQSSLIQELRMQHSDAPEEQREEMTRRPRIDEKDRKNYEEDFMIRLQMTKKNQKESKSISQQSALDSLLSFGDYMAMDRGESSSKRGRNTGSKQGSQRKGQFRKKSNTKRPKKK